MNKRNRMQAMKFRAWSTAFFTVLALLLPTTGKSLTQSEQVLSLEQAVTIALKNNPGFAQQVNGMNPGLSKNKETGRRYESKLTYALQALHSYEERYRVGASTLIELTDARAQYVQATFDQVQAKYDLVTQEIAVTYYLGNMKQMLAALSLEKN